MTDESKFKRYRLEALLATWLCYGAFYFTRKVFAVVKSPIKEQFAIDDLALSHLWTIYLVTYMLGQFLAAWLGRRMQSRRILTYGMTIAATCNIAIGLLVDSKVASAYVWMLVVMAIHGFAQATGWPHTIAMVANWTKRSERGFVTAIWGTCYQIGSIGGKALAAFLFGWLGTAWSFFGSSIVLLIVTAIFIAIGRESPTAAGLAQIEEEKDEVAAEQQSTSASGSIAPAFLRLIIAMGLIYFGFKFVRYALDSWSALILREHFAMTTTTAGYLSAAFDFVGFIGVVAGGMWSDRLSGSRREPVIFFMTAGCLVATVAMWLVGLSSPVFFVVLLGLIGLTAMGPDALLSGASAMDAGSRKQAALAAGVINGVGSLGPIVQEPAIGFLKSREGLDSVFLLLVIVVLLSTIGTGLLWKATAARAKSTSPS